VIVKTVAGRRPGSIIVFDCLPKKKEPQPLGSEAAEVPAVIPTPDGQDSYRFKLARAG
jgi:hypothetical protein